MHWLLRELRFEIMDFRERLAFWIRPGSGYDEAHDAYQDVSAELVVAQQQAAKDQDWERVRVIRGLRREFDELGMALGGHFQPALPPGKRAKIEAAAAALPSVMLYKSLRDAIDEQSSKPDE